MKRIVRYLKGTKDKRLLFTPSSNYEVDSYVAADFAGLWHYEDDLNPVPAKLGTGYMMVLLDAPNFELSNFRQKLHFLPLKPSILL